MSLESLKFYIQLQVIFLVIMIVFDVGMGFDLDMPEPPQFSGSAILGDSLNSIINDIKSASPFGWILGTAVQIISVLISITIFAVSFIFFITAFLAFWWIPSSMGILATIINIFLGMLRILLILELIPYIKNLIAPHTEASH